MAVLEADWKSLFLDEEGIRRVVAEQNTKSGFVPDATATPQQAQARVEQCLRAAGLRLGDNIFSGGIIAAAVAEAAPPLGAGFGCRCRRWRRRYWHIM